jgi:hypothetical protein
MHTSMTDKPECYFSRFGVDEAQPEGRSRAIPMEGWDSTPKEAGFVFFLLHRSRTKRTMSQPDLVSARLLLINITDCMNFSRVSV